jgi:hypothetical protein
MAAYLVYVETLDPETRKISRDWTPIGYVYGAGVADGRELAREEFKLRGNQRPILESNPYTVRKITQRMASAATKGKPIDFAEAWRRMIKARRGGKIFQEDNRL